MSDGRVAAIDLRCYSSQAEISANTREPTFSTQSARSGHRDLPSARLSEEARLACRPCVLRVPIPSRNLTHDIGGVVSIGVGFSGHRVLDIRHVFSGTP
jgi:hypothetical protein